ncbi:MAG: ABC transporter substrate-binding protein [Alphaproteobacteria bacterium]|nr:MAG: ABC transporter substrate-binding protein [Alphaproteobacteria bacterium]
MVGTGRTVSAIFAALLLVTCQASAQDTLRIATGSRGDWNGMVGELGQRAGIFRKHGIVLDILYTAGSGETLQAVISNSVDVGTAVGTIAVMAAFSKGAPVRIIGAETTGAAEYWYASTLSSIHSLKDTDGKTIGYSTNGASTHLVVMSFMRELGLKARPVATGNSVSTLTQVMSGQVDVGWASPAFGLKELKDDKIRIVARASDLAVVRGQTIRVLAVNAETLAKRGELLARYMTAYRETLDYMYGSDPKVMQDYSDFAGTSLAFAQQTRDEFYSKEMLNPDEIRGVDVLMRQAIQLNFLAAPLTSEQLNALIRIPSRAVRTP